LGIAAGPAAIASGRAVAVASRIAQAGETVSLAGQIALKSATAVSSFNCALGVVNELANIIEKIDREDKVTSLHVFQFMSSVLFFANSVISIHQAHCLIRSIKENGTGGSSGSMHVIRGLINAIGVSSIAVSSVVKETLFSICKWVCRKLSAITKMLLKGLTAVKEYAREVVDLLHIFWEKWNEEIKIIAIEICQAFGVKNWSDIIVKGSRILQGSE
jgi:hypothetical protein